MWEISGGHHPVYTQSLSKSPGASASWFPGSSTLATSLDSKGNWKDQPELLFTAYETGRKVQEKRDLPKAIQ